MGEIPPSLPFPNPAHPAAARVAARAYGLGLGGPSAPKVPAQVEGKPGVGPSTASRVEATVDRLEFSGGIASRSARLDRLIGARVDVPAVGPEVRAAAERAATSAKADRVGAEQVGGAAASLPFYTRPEERNGAATRIAAELGRGRSLDVEA